VKRISLLITLVVGSLTGCTSPQNTNARCAVSQTWPSGAAYASSEQLGGFMTMQRQTSAGVSSSDARLQELIDLALANNRDLRVAVLNVERSARNIGFSARLVADILPARVAHASGRPATSTARARRSPRVNTT